MKMVALTVVLVASGFVPASGQGLSINDYRSAPEDIQFVWVDGFVSGLRSGAVGVWVGYAIAGGLLDPTIEEEAASFLKDPTAEEGAALFLTWAWGNHDLAVDMNDCVEEWALGQYKAVFDRYIEDRPEIWHESVSEHLRTAVVAACRT